MTRLLAFLLLAAIGVVHGEPSPSSSATPAPSASPTPSPSPSPEATPAPTPDVGAVIRGMSGAQIEKAIAAIKANYFQTDAVSEAELQRALFEGLISKLGPGAEIKRASDESVKTKPAPFLAEILDSKIGYFRLGSISAESLAQMDAALKKFVDQGLKDVIVDLRGCPPSYDYELGADIARRFCQKGKLLFSVQKPSAKQERIFTSNQEPVFDGTVIVIVDEENAGAAEAIAAALRVAAQAMVVGEKTSGGAVEFTDIELGDQKVLRVANAQVVLPDGENIYPKGVRPDIKVRIDKETQQKIFRLSQEKGISQYIFEKEHPRLNEAALVAQTNPEITGIQEARESEDNQPIYDNALQRAVDLVTTIEFYKKRK